MTKEYKTYSNKQSEQRSGLEKHLGEKITLPVEKIMSFGAYLGESEDHVLLPAKQVPADTKVGDLIDVFLYKDSKDRLIATVHEPKITLGEIKVLQVKETAKIGAFLDWGLEKDLLLPFREQTAPVKAGEECLVALYVDKSGRLCATMKVYEMLSTDSPYWKDHHVEGIIYDKSDRFGWFVAVDDKYSALIPAREGKISQRIGDRIRARVTEVKPDGKLTLSLREKAYLQMDTDADQILEDLRKRGGAYPFTDKADADLIRQETGLSKNAFKRAVGKLLREEIVEITDTQIRLTK